MARLRIPKTPPRILHVGPSKRTFRALQKSRVVGLPSRLSQDAAPQLVCSYNWVVHETQISGPIARINVPGDVPVYRPGRVKLPRVVEEGKAYEMTGGLETFQMCSVPFEALFLATRVMNPTFRFDKVDLVIPLSMLTKFLFLNFQSLGVDPVGCTRFDNSSSDDRPRNSNHWSATMYTIQNTLFIHSDLPRNFSSRTELRSITAGGLHFEQDVKTLRGAKFDGNALESHHRAIQCRLAGLNCVILYEADARWLSEGQPDDTAVVPHPQHTTQQPALYSLDNRVPVFRQGSGAPQSDIVEIKLRSRWRAWEWGGEPNSFLPRVEQEDKDDVWFSTGHAKDSLRVYLTHTPRVVTGYVKKGTVQFITISDTTRARKQMAYELSPHLHTLGGLFRRLRKIAREVKRPCSLNTSPWSSIKVDTEDANLPGKHPIPQEIVEALWEGVKSPETANTPTAGESQQSTPTKGQSKDAASLPDSKKEATKSVNVRTQGRQRSTLPRGPKPSPSKEWENLRRELAALVMGKDSKKDHPPTRSHLHPRTATTKNESIIGGSSLLGNSQPETKQRTQSDAEIVMETREVLQRGSQRLAELARVLVRL